MASLHKKYQIFISSSVKDLTEERKAIVGDILNMGHIPYGMESFSPGNEQELKVIKSAIQQSDIYIVLVGSRYGSVVEEKGQSFTQLEYRIAQDEGKPILAFLLEKEEFDSYRNSLDANDQENKYQDRIIKFRNEVKAIDKKKTRNRIVGFFSNKPGGIGDLKLTVRDGIQKLISQKKFKAKGWIRGDAYESTKLPEEINNNIFIRDVVERLCEFDTLSKRITKINSMLKIEMSTFFWKHYINRIISKNIKNLFFGSGSTMAYIATKFREHLNEDYGRENQDEWKITTNNVLTFLEFVLRENINIRIFPHGPPDNKYGATYGGLKKSPTPAPPTELDEPSEKEIECRNSLVDLLSNTISPELYLISPSGFEVNLESPFVGPHVGSYHNKLYKRCTFSCGKPVIMFLDESKILPKSKKAIFTKGNCYPIFNSDFCWNDAQQTLPIAICSIAKTESGRKEIIKLLEPFGFSPFGLEDDSGKFKPVILENNKFQDIYR